MGEPLHHSDDDDDILGQDPLHSQQDPSASTGGRKAPSPPHHALESDSFEPRRLAADARHSTSSTLSDHPEGQDLEMVNVMQTGYSAVAREDGGLADGEPKIGQRRRRSTVTLNGQEIGVEEFDPAKLAQMLGNKDVLHKSLVNGVLIALWYIFSISISVYNKWMFSKTNMRKNPGGKVVFPFPLFTTSFHMVIQFCLASLVLYFFPRYRPKREMDEDETHRSDVPQADHPPDDEPKKALLTPFFYITRIAPCGTATGLDIGLGNTSLKFITLTFFTMCKSSTLGFVLLFAIVFGLEKPSWKLGAIILVMTVGVIMMVAGEAAFSTIGFVLLMLASFFSGLRWSLTQILLRRNPATSNPFASLFFLTPIMFLVLIIIALPVEGPSNISAGFADLIAAKGLPLGIIILLFPGILAFLMTSSEFALLKRTSVVTLSVCGIFKEVITITAAGMIFGDDLTPINISGLVVTICAIAAYNYIRMKKMKRKSAKKAQDLIETETEERAPMLNADGERIGGGGGSAGSGPSFITSAPHHPSPAAIVSAAFKAEPRRRGPEELG